MTDSRIMGLDYGSKTVGVALSDEKRVIAVPYTTIVRQKENKLRRTIAELRNIIADKNVGLIVLGLPLNMDETVGERAEKTMEFKELLESKLGLKVELEDERLTSYEADDLMSLAGIPASKRKQHSDEIAAAIILKDYMNNRL